jgi:hypothetical protein
MKNHKQIIFVILIVAILLYFVFFFSIQGHYIVDDQLTSSSLSSSSSKKKTINHPPELIQREPQPLCATGEVVSPCPSENLYLAMWNMRRHVPGHKWRLIEIGSNKGYTLAALLDSLQVSPFFRLAISPLIFMTTSISAT